MIKSKPLDDPTPSPQSQQKLLELDLLRVLAIALVLYCHSTAYLGWSAHVNELMKYPGPIGVGLFLCLSGFLCQRSQNKKKSKRTRWEVFRKRLIRIFPLYWLALFTFIVIFHVLSIFHNLDFSPLPATTVAHFFGLQLFLRSRYISHIPTLWYIGALVTYYGFFILMSRFKFKNFLILNVLFFALVILLKIVLKHQSIHLVENRIIMNYPLFLAGVIAGRFDSNLLYLKRHAMKFTLGLGIVAFLLFRVIDSESITRPHNFLIGWVDLRFYSYIFLWALFFINLGILVTPFMLKFSQPIEYLSKISYAVYLFHRPVYALIYGLLLGINLGSTTIRTLIFPIATLLVLLASHYITRFDIKVLKPKATQVMSKLFPKTATRG
ncbi:MAG: acyltransferase [Sodalinema sp.]|uniref:acyltransferase family protein n=1 Tax=Sodalinema sp. TaxID=3080550 RepID=UPI00396F5205